MPRLVVTLALLLTTAVVIALLASRSAPPLPMLGGPARRSTVPSVAPQGLEVAVADVDATPPAKRGAARSNPAAPPRATDAAPAARPTNPTAPPPEPETHDPRPAPVVSPVAEAPPPRTDAPSAASPGPDDARPAAPPALTPTPTPTPASAPDQPRPASPLHHTIVGRCVQRGRPAAGIEVRLDRASARDVPSSSAPTAMLTNTVTDADGNFTLELIGDGPCQLTFRGTGTSRHQLPTHLDANDIARAPDLQLGDLELTAVRRVVGRVLHADGRPATATVSTSPESPPLAHTDGDGRFACDDVGPGPIDLLVSAKDAEASIHVPAFANTLPPPSTAPTAGVFATADDVFDAGQVTVRAMLTCTGTVHDDAMVARRATLRLVENASAPPPAATTAVAATAPMTAISTIATVVTDPAGHFSLRVPADATVACEADGCLPLTIAAADLARMATRLCLPRSLALTGTVSRGNATPEVRVQPVPGDASPWLALALARCGEPFAVAADGAFHCDRLPPGLYTVVAVAAGSGASVAVDQSLPQQSPLQLTLRGGRTVDLLVADDRGEPIAYAAIEVTAAANAADSTAGATRGAETPRTTATSPDQERIASTTAHFPVTTPPHETVPAAPPSSSHPTDVDPLVAAAPPTTRTEQWRADAHGRVTIAVPPDAVTIRVRPDHHLAAHIDAATAAGTPSAPLHVACNRTAQLHGRIDDAADFARYDLAVAIWPADGSAREQRERTTELLLDRTGTFTADSIRPGRYNVALVRRDRTHRRANDPNAVDSPAPDRPGVDARGKAAPSQPADRAADGTADQDDHGASDHGKQPERAPAGPRFHPTDHWTGSETPLLAAGVDSRTVALVTVTAGESTEVTVPVPPLATISGTVRQGPRPAAGVVVFAVPLGDPGNGFAGGWDAPGAAQLAPNTLTDAAGKFTFLVARPGRFELRTRQPHQPFALPPIPATVAHYGDALDVTVSLPTGAIRGTLPAFAGDPLTIELRATDDNLHAVAVPQRLQSGDAFEFAPVPPGHYRIVASRLGHPIGEWTADVVATTTDLGTVDLRH